jgi:putative flavoprotein involved in K+ transport
VPDVRTLIVGAGQAGLALSRYLTRMDHGHVLLERGRIGERWRSERWDSMALLTPNWMSRLPGSAPHPDPDGFTGKDAFAAYLDAYARSFAAPVHRDVSVLDVSEAHAGGFRVHTDSGDWHAANVVVASGYADEPRIPAPAAAAPRGLLQLHSSGYRSAGQLPAGGVLVVGAGPSGQQIAADLRRSGRSVVIAVGRHARMPRRYRSRDIWRWFAANGSLDQTLDDVPRERGPAASPSLALSGARGGEQLDLGVLAEAGVVVTGRLRGWSGRHALFGDDLAAAVEESEQRMRRVLAKIDRHIEARGECDVPPAQPVLPVVLPTGPRTLDLAEAGISTVIWATGYRRSYPWLSVPALGDGEIRHHRGITEVPGLYALGLRFQHRRSSHFIAGVGEDARFLAQQIAAGSDAHLAAAG